MSANYESMIDQKYGRLTVKEIVRVKWKQAMARCDCECGGSSVAKVCSVRSGHTKSCGCNLARTGFESANYRHGQEGTPTYSTWQAMKTRCSNPNSQDYPRYGGRGISVCDRWLRFENFYADMGRKPQGTSLNRIDNDKGYSPENCHWASHKQQARNRKSTRTISYNGETRCVAEWAEILHIPQQVLFRKLNRGCSFDRIFTTLFSSSDRSAHVS